MLEKVGGTYLIDEIPVVTAVGRDRSQKDTEANYACFSSREPMSMIKMDRVEQQSTRPLVLGIYEVLG